ncbi:hypothetical protein [Halomonas sp. E19]|uniref:hypothetical protein n=1 Tax=Halomonas sp. E19 TaxID=3397247 RepID=UPI00403469C5
MPGFLQRFLAPRWQHRDAQVRLQAVSRLDPTHPDQRRALAALCLDDTPSVRQAALMRFDDPAPLLPLLTQQPDNPELQHRLAALLTGKAGALALAQRIDWVARLPHRDLLMTIALEGDNQQLRLAALAGLHEESDLIHQACENGIAAVRHAAAARVASEAGLQALAGRARRDRQVMRQARERLNRLRADAASLIAARERREALLGKLEAHANAPGSLFTAVATATWYASGRR